jgi:hypothetical protein
MSTYPVALGSFAVLSGTSMATPFAPVVPPYFLLRRARDPRLSQKVLEPCLKPHPAMIPASKNDTGFDTLSKAGAGLINVYKAIHSTTVVSPGELILNDTAHFQGK